MGFELLFTLLAHEQVPHDSGKSFPPAVFPLMSHHDTQNGYLVALTREEGADAAAQNALRVEAGRPSFVFFLSDYPSGKTGQKGAHADLLCCVPVTIPGIWISGWLMVQGDLKLGLMLAFRPSLHYCPVVRSLCFPRHNGLYSPQTWNSCRL